MRRNLSSEYRGGVAVPIRPDQYFELRVRSLQGACLLVSRPDPPLSAVPHAIHRPPGPPVFESSARRLLLPHDPWISNVDDVWDPTPLEAPRRVRKRGEREANKNRGVATRAPTGQMPNGRDLIPVKKKAVNEHLPKLALHASGDSRCLTAPCRLAKSRPHVLHLSPGLQSRSHVSDTLAPWDERIVGPGDDGESGLQF